jgi:hypothetical protein
MNLLKSELDEEREKWSRELSDEKQVGWKSMFRMEIFHIFDRNVLNYICDFLGLRSNQGLSQKK